MLIVHLTLVEDQVSSCPVWNHWTWSSCLSSFLLRMVVQGHHYCFPNRCLCSDGDYFTSCEVSMGILLAFKFKKIHILYIFLHILGYRSELTHCRRSAQRIVHHHWRTFYDTMALFMYAKVPTHSRHVKWFRCVVICLRLCERSLQTFSHEVCVGGNKGTCFGNLLYMVAKFDYVCTM